MCSNAREQPRAEYPIRKENERTCRVRIKKILLRATKNVNLFKGTLGNLHCRSRIGTQFVAGNRTDNCHNRKQVSYMLLSDKSFSTVNIGRMR